MINNNRKKYLIIGGIVAAALILLSILLNAATNGTLEIKAPQTQNNAEINIKLTDEQGGIKELRLASGATTTISLRTGTHRVNSSVGESRAVDIVKINAGSTTRLELTFGVQLTSTKVGSDAEFCPYQVDNTIYSYNCLGDGFIYRHPGADDRKIPVMESQYFGYMTSYSSGFLGFPITNPNEESRKNLVLHFIDMKTQSMQKVSLPSSIPTDNLSSNSMIITPNDPTKTFFALVVRDQSKIFLFKNTTDTNPVSFSLPTDKKFKDDNTAPALSFDGDTLVVYMGRSVTGEEHDGQEDNDSGVPNDGSQVAKADGKVYEYNLEGKLGRTFSVPDDFWADAIHRLTNDYFATTNIRGTEVFFVRGDKLERIYRLGDTINSVSAKGQLYMIVDNGIFTFTPQQNGLFSLQNAFNKSGLRVSNVYNNTGPILFTGYEGDEAGALLNIYTLK